MIPILRRICKRTVGRSFVLGMLSVAALSLCGASNGNTVNWQMLQTLNFSIPLSQQTGAALQLNGKVVSIPGFMVPLEDDADKVTEFLLVPYAGACIHVPPPPPNQMVYVKMNGDSKVKVTFTDPIIVTGQLKISTVQSPYGDVSYDMTGVTVKPYEP